MNYHCNHAFPLKTNTNSLKNLSSNKWYTEKLRKQKNKVVMFQNMWKDTTGYYNRKYKLKLRY